MQIKISTRHGSLLPEEQAHLQAKAEKLLKVFDRLMSIEVAAEHRKNDWQIEILVSAEHKHDFIAREEAATPGVAMDLCIHKIEEQLRRYKEKIQDHHKGGTSHGGSPVTQAEEDEPARTASEAADGSD